MQRNTLFFGDNLEVLKNYIPAESIDLVYLDPPFNSKANYSVANSKTIAFKDTWQWDANTTATLDELMVSNPDLGILLKVYEKLMKQNSLAAYLVMMGNRLVELHKALKPTGSLYLHCDSAASHYLKTLLDCIFDANNFRADICWERSKTRSSISKAYRKGYDSILFYSKTKNYIFSLSYKNLSETSKRMYKYSDDKGFYRSVPLLVSGKRNGNTGEPWHSIDPNTKGKNGMHWITIHEKLEEYDKKGLILWGKKPGTMPTLKYYLEENQGVPINDVWCDISLITSSANESLGYPTQKPLALLERIIQASSNPGDTVLDPFCGSGTTLHAAQQLGRHWIGIDSSEQAIPIALKRLRVAFPDALINVFDTQDSADDF